MSDEVIIHAMVEDTFGPELAELYAELVMEQALEDCRRTSEFLRLMDKHR